MNNFSKFLRAPFDVKILLVRTTLYLVFAQLCVANVSLPALMKTYKLKKLGPEERAEPTRSSVTYIEQVYWAVTTIHNQVPLMHHARCLAQALTARQLLLKKQIPSVLFLGAAIRGQKQLEAHAWLTCCSLTLNFGDDTNRYTELVKFY